MQWGQGLHLFNVNETEKIMELSLNIVQVIFAINWDQKYEQLKLTHHSYGLHVVSVSLYTENI